MLSRADGLGPAGGQSDLRLAVCGNLNGINRFPVLLLPFALHLAENDRIRRVGARKVSAGLRRNGEVIFAVDLNAAHRGEQPFDHRAL